MIIDKIEPANYKNKVEVLEEFIEKIIYLSSMCEINGLHNANWHLPNLVHNTFKKEYIDEVVNKFQ